MIPARFSTWTLCAFIVSLLIAALLPAQAARAEDVWVELIPKGSKEVPLGDGFRFTAVIHNDTEAAMIVKVVFYVRSLDSDGVAPTAFSRVYDSVPAGGTSTTDHALVTGQYSGERGRFLITGTSAQTTVTDTIEIDVTKPVVRLPRFINVTQTAGLTTDAPRDGACGRWTAGGAWADVEGDGDLDLYTPRQDVPAHLFINDGSGYFTDEASLRGVDNGSAVGLSASFADYDNDGDPDLYVGNLGPNRFYVNDGNGNFVDMAPVLGIAGDGNTSSASWGDYDNDGFIDLYVTNHHRCTTREPELDVDYLYHNNGDGTFTDVTGSIEKDFALTSDGATTGAGFQMAWFDYDRDGDVDMLLGNDFYGPNADENHLWRNDGSAGAGGWNFTDVSTQSGMKLRMNTMGIAIGDYNQDGWLDAGLSNISDNRLMNNDGDGTFTDVGNKAGIARPLQTVGANSVTWGMVFGDFNLDTWEDIYTAAGSLSSDPEQQPNELFVNGGKGKFYDLSVASGTSFEGISRGVALADYDRDGRLDMWVGNLLNSPILYRNVTTKKNRHWLELDLTGTTSNRDACGAWLTLTVGSKKLFRQVMCGGTSLGSSHDPVQHFGLGKFDVVDKISITWPSGTKQVLRNVKADRLKAITEPSGS